MARLKLGALENDKPVKITFELPAQVHRDLIAYAEALGGESNSQVEPVRLIAPMLSRFMATDRQFLKHLRTSTDRGQRDGPG